MPGRNKGFDPLSSLFEAPEPGLAAPPPEPAPAAAALPPAPSPPAPVADPGVVPDPGAVDLPKAKKAPGIDKAAIAKAVAAAAAARIKAQAAKAAKAPRSAPTPAPTPTPTPVQAPTVKKRSRLDTLASRSVRPRGDALAAARAAAAQETAVADQVAEDSRQAHARKVSVQVEALVPTLLPGVESVRVVNAIIVDQRDVLKALWTGHRSRFIRDGQLERAVGAAVVLQAIEAVRQGSLVAAHVETSASDYLVWIDVARNQVLAAFPDARAYFSAS